MSSFYFDIRKDSLYCDSPKAIPRRAARTVLDILFNYLTTLFSPILCFTAEEVMQSRFPDIKTSIHESNFPLPNEKWINNSLFDKWEKIRSVRKVVTGAIELERKEKRIGSSLEAFPTVFISDKEYSEIFKNIDLAEIFITSQAVLKEGEGPDNAFKTGDMKMVSVVCGLSEGGKCSRSWKILPEVGTDPDYPDLSIRDAAVIRKISEQ